jgi:DNA (cytosine-5)-methyltransferase 1
MPAATEFEFFEFFSGGGMARLGLGSEWRCTFSNDLDEAKAASYRRNFNSAPELKVGDVGALEVSELPGKPALAWASFPCQDLSLAGYGRGLAGERSGVFWSFWRLISLLKKEGRHPPLIALENVRGLITSNGGRDLTLLVQAMVDSGYRVGGLEIDASSFVPQSRPRLFLIALADTVDAPPKLTATEPNLRWHPESLRAVVESFEADLRSKWLWWSLPQPRSRVKHFKELIEVDGPGLLWDAPHVTERILQMMSPANLAKVNAAKLCSSPQVGTVYKRTRQGVQRAEIRFDGLSGCLRTPAGGSSRQVVMVVHGDLVRTRLITARETARLMGLPESYELPSRYTDAYHLTGDGVVVPVVAWLAKHLLGPLARRTHILDVPLHASERRPSYANCEAA